MHSIANFSSSSFFFRAQVELDESFVTTSAAAASDSEGITLSWSGVSVSVGLEEGSRGIAGWFRKTDPSRTQHKHILKDGEPDLSPVICW